MRWKSLALEHHIVFLISLKATVTTCSNTTYVIWRWKKPKQLFLFPPCKWAWVTAPEWDDESNSVRNLYYRIPSEIPSRWISEGFLRALQFPPTRWISYLSMNGGVFQTLPFQLPPGPGGKNQWINFPCPCRMRLLRCVTVSKSILSSLNESRDSNEN